MLGQHREQRQGGEESSLLIAGRHSIRVAIGRESCRGPLLANLLKQRSQVAAQGLGTGASEQRIRLRVRADRALAGPRLKLVYNAERLPLDPDDGTVVHVTPIDLATGQPGQPVPLFQCDLVPDWSPIGWEAQLPQPGWVRLFADLPADSMAVVAILDPPIRQLWVSGR